MTRPETVKRVVACFMVVRSGAKRCHGGIGVQRDRDPVMQRRGRCIPRRCPVRANREIYVLVAPGPNVVGKDVCERAQRGQATVLRTGAQLAEWVAVWRVLRLRVLGEDGFKRLDEQLGCLVAVAVDVDQEAGTVEGFKRLVEFLRADGPDSVGLSAV